MTTKRKNLILAILTILIASFMPALIFNKWYEAVSFFICHTTIRPQFPRQYHHVVPAMCRTITASVFFFGISFVLPLEYSIISAVPINYLISWVGCVKADRDFYQRKVEDLQFRFCNEKEELLRKCRLANLSERDTLFAVMSFYERKTPKEIWLWLCEQNKYEIVEWNTIYHILWQIGKKIRKTDRE